MPTGWRIRGVGGMQQIRPLGFTLVEVLVALAVFAVLAVAGAALLGQSIDNDAQLARVDAKVQALQQARAIMRADFGQALANRPVRHGDGAVRPGFTVQQDGALLSLVRLAAAPDGPDTAIVQRVSYVLEPGRGLVRRHYAPPDGNSDAQERVLLADARAVSVRLFAEGGWQEAAQWTPEQGLPAAVALEVEGAAGETTTFKYLTPAAANLGLQPAGQAPLG